MARVPKRWVKVWQCVWVCGFPSKSESSKIRRGVASASFQLSVQAEGGCDRWCTSGKFGNLFNYLIIWGAQSSRDDVYSAYYTSIFQVKRTDRVFSLVAAIPEQQVTDFTIL
ncbi:hypothetical protein BDR07DRAFT_1377144 [Suillus spraguei]|nr:hypothetical protein BDR07DRAFT_1377144 [Suillus spraguei]